MKGKTLSFWRLGLCWGLASIGFSFASSEVEPSPDADPEAPARLSQQARAVRQFEAYQARYADDDDTWVAPGVVARRTPPQVELWAEATGLSSDEPVEFILIGETSGHDYEAIAVSYARPSDVHAALVFIGMEPGAPFNPRARRFFPRGERVFATVEWTDEDGREHKWSVEELIRDGRVQASMAREGFAFVGSQRIEVDGRERYAADVWEPQSILSIYNEPTTVLDRPGIVPQAAVYGFLHPYPDRQPAAGQWLRFRLEPEFTDGRRRVAELTLEAKAEVNDYPVHLQLLDAQGSTLHDDPTVGEVLRTLQELAAAERSPFLTLIWSEDLPLNELRDLIQVLAALEAQHLLFIEPPPDEAFLFHRAFLPQAEHRDPAQRPSQALELRLTHETDMGVAARIRDIKDVRERRDEPFVAAIEEFPVHTPEELPALLEEIDHRLPVLLVFAPATMTYGEAMTWVKPVLATLPTVYFFLESD